MKKTLFALLALGSLAMGEMTTAFYFEQGTTNATELSASSIPGVSKLVSTDSRGLGPNTPYTADLITLDPYTKLEIDLDKGKLGYTEATNGTWSNTAALNEMNTTLGLNLTVDHVNSLKLYSPGAQSSHTTLTFQLGEGGITKGSDAVFYVLVACRESAMNNFSVTGLTETKYQYATYNGDGFVDTATFSPYVGGDDPKTTEVVEEALKPFTLIKVTGIVNAAEISMTSSNAKNGFAFVAYQQVPEPTTATLSLLALAGLAARRRRK